MSAAPAAWHYAEGRRLSRRGRGLAAGSIVALHALALLALLRLHREPPPREPLPVVSMRLIAEAPVMAIPPPPRPAPPPKPERRVIATPRATPAPISAPPEEAVPQPVATPVATEPSPPAPAAPAPPAAEPSVVPPDFVAAYLDNPAPAYPPAAKARGAAGRVLLRVRVGAEGRAREVLIQQSSGHGALDEAARDIVARRWRFVPARRGEEPIEAWVLIPFDFTLK